MNDAPVARVLGLYRTASGAGPRLFDIAIWISDIAEQHGVVPETANKIAALSVRKILDAFGEATS
jgi:hypothetical protein